MAKLRAVTEDETPPQLMTLVEAVQHGDYRQILLAQQREIAGSVGDEKGPAKAALHRQLAIISKELQALNAAAEQEATESAEVPDEAFDTSAV